MTQSEIQKTVLGVHEHIEDDDPQPEQILITPGHVTMAMNSVDDLLDWTDTVADFFETDGEGEDVAFTAQLLWKQTENEPAPSVITAVYGWEFEDGHVATFRIYASSPITMDQLADATTDDRIEVTRSQVETLMLQGHARKAGLPKVKQ